MVPFKPIRIIGAVLLFVSAICSFYTLLVRKDADDKINMQQTELAKLVGARRETIGNFVNDRYNPSLKLAIDIAKVFDTTVEYIFTFEEDDK